VKVSYFSDVSGGQMVYDPEKRSKEGELAREGGKKDAG
jgi:hypothetical protein